MNWHRQMWMRAVALAFVCVFSWSTTAYGQAVTIAPTMGHKAPDFQLYKLSGGSMSLAGLQGKPVFVNFFASWCPPCQRETPDLVKLYKKYGQQIQFVGVDLTVNDSEADVKRLVHDFGVKYPVLLDVTGRVAQQYQVLGIPTSLLISRNGTVVDRTQGGLGMTDLEARMQQLLRAPF